jgi:hypothetical protein
MPEYIKYEKIAVAFSLREKAPRQQSTVIPIRKKLDFWLQPHLEAYVSVSNKLNGTRALKTAVSDVLFSLGRIISVTKTV